jgi:hypothetical protein
LVFNTKLFFAFTVTVLLKKRDSYGICSGICLKYLWWGGALLQEEEKQRDFYNLLEACAAGDLASVKTILGWTFIKFFRSGTGTVFQDFWYPLRIFSLLGIRDVYPGSRIRFFLSRIQG